MWETVSALCVVLGGIIVVCAGLRALGVGTGSLPRSRMRVVETLSLGNRQRLHVVEVAGERMLVGATEQQVNLLRNLPPEPEGELLELGGLEAEEDGAGRSVVSPAPEWLERLRAAARASLPMWIGFIGVLALPEFAQAQESVDIGPATLSLALDEATTPARISSTMQIVALLTLISVAPSLILMTTCYVRILIVLMLLRQAMGTHQLPPRQVLVSLSLFTTLFVMAPVGEQIYQEALVPYTSEEIDIAQAGEIAAGPVREYLLSHTRVNDLGLFYEMAGEDLPEVREDAKFRMLLPAYLISEIRTAFEIGFMIYLPFLVVDILVASMLISMGMMVLPPMMISLPFKLMLFVLLDGWNLLLSALVTGLQ